MSSIDNSHEGKVLTHTRQRTEEPPMYKVLLHNDDYTTMEFVIYILEKVFRKTMPEATRIMLNVHQRGIGVAGVYNRELAETKTATVEQLARKNEYPLKCSLEKV